MGKVASDGMIDGGLDKMATCTTLAVLSGEPANFAAIAGLVLASVVIDAGDFTKANGDADGRKVTIAAQSDASITASGTASHVVIHDGTDYLVTTCTDQALTSGGTVTIPAWDVEIADPV